LSSTLTGFLSVDNGVSVEGLIQGRFEQPKLLVTDDAAVVLFGFDERGGGST
jgi:hypothetical protein